MAEITITVKQKTKTIESDSGEDLLSTCLANKVRLDHICRNGICGACQVLIEEGAENLSSAPILEKLLLDDTPLKAGVRLACQAKLVGGKVKVIQPTFTQEK